MNDKKQDDEEALALLELGGEAAPLERFTHFLRWLHFSGRPVRLRFADGTSRIAPPMPDRHSLEWAAFWHRAWDRSTGVTEAPCVPVQRCAVFVTASRIEIHMASERPST